MTTHWKHGSAVWENAILAYPDGEAVLALTDAELLDEAKARSGLTYAEFAEQVCCTHVNTVKMWRRGLYSMHPLTRLVLRREVAKARAEASGSR